MVSTTTIPYDYLVFAVGAEVQTFNIPGVREHACFMKELEDAEKMQRRFLDCKYLAEARVTPTEPRSGLESAAFPGQSTEEIKRLLHMVGRSTAPVDMTLTWCIRLSSVVALPVLS